MKAPPPSLELDWVLCGMQLLLILILLPVYSHVVSLPVVIQFGKCCLPYPWRPLSDLEVGGSRSNSPRRSGRVSRHKNRGRKLIDSKGRHNAATVSHFLLHARDSLHPRGFSQLCFLGTRSTQNAIAMRSGCRGGPCLVQAQDPKQSLGIL